MRPVAKRALEIINYEIVLNISCQILTSAASPMEQRRQQRLAQFQAGLSACTGRCRGMGKHVHEGKRRTGRCSQQGESEKEESPRKNLLWRPSCSAATKRLRLVAGVLTTHWGDSGERPFTWATPNGTHNIA